MWVVKEKFQRLQDRMWLFKKVVNLKHCPQKAGQQLPNGLRAHVSHISTIRSPTLNHYYVIPRELERIVAPFSSPVGSESLMKPERMSPAVRSSRPHLSELRWTSSMQQEERRRDETTQSTCVKSPGTHQVFREEKLATNSSFCCQGHFSQTLLHKLSRYHSLTSLRRTLPAITCLIKPIFLAPSDFLFGASQSHKVSMCTLARLSLLNTPQRFWKYWISSLMGAGRLTRLGLVKVAVWVFTFTN